MRELLVIGGIEIGGATLEESWPEILAAVRGLEEQLETYRAALDSIVNAKSYVSAAGYVFTGDEAQELAIKRAAELVSSPASRSQREIFESATESEINGIEAT